MTEVFTRVFVSHHSIDQYRARIDQNANQDSIEQEFRRSIPAGKKKRRRMMKSCPRQQDRWDDERYNFYLTERAVFVGYSHAPGWIFVVTAWEAGDERTERSHVPVRYTTTKDWRDRRYHDIDDDQRFRGQKRKA